MRARRLLAALALTIPAFSSLALLAAPTASAHPLGNFTVNRFAELRLTPGRLQLTYVLDMAEIPTFQERRGIDANGDGAVSAGERQAWADRRASMVLRGIGLTVQGSAIDLTARGATMSFRPGQGGLPTLYFTAVYVGAVGPSGRVRFTDANEADRIGWKEIVAAGADGVAVSGSDVPAATVSDELRAYPVDLLSSPLDVRSASFTFAPGRSAAVASSGTDGRTVSGSPVASGGAFAGLVRWRLTPFVFVLSMLLAFAFGAIHALGPGHGKTITAAYLVGRGARSRQAVAAGVAVSLMHTVSVLALGLVALVLIHSFPTDRVYPWLGLVTGLVAFGLGSVLLVTRLRARRAGTDPWHGHPHADHEDHVHGHEDPAGGGAITGRGLAALAVSGGILPSPTALVVLTAAVASHRVAYGLGLVVAFSAGLAAALMLVAVVALRARSVVSRRLGTRLAGAIPIASAAVIVGFGLFFVLRGAAQV